MGRIWEYLTGQDLVSPNGHESRTLTRGYEAPVLSYAQTTALPSISEASALKCADIFACCRVLANAIGAATWRATPSRPSGRASRRGPVVLAS